MEKTEKRGFTLVEMLVAMFVLVIAFALVTYLYTRAARIRRIVVVHSEVQQVLSQVADIITYGERGRWGLIHATGIQSGGSSMVTAVNESGTPDMMEIRIDDGGAADTIALAWISDPGDYYTEKIFLDIDGKIMLRQNDSPELPASMFEYFDGGGNLLVPGIDDIGETTFIKITLWARSTDPSFDDAPPIPFVTGVRLRNSLSF